MKPGPLSIISLTESGYALASRLLAVAPEAEHLHRPQPFADIVQARYQAGHRLVFITAMGIAVRTLAPVLKDKTSDPAVLVMDELGRYIVPLLSGHEGGANAWASEWAQILGATPVITTARTYTTPLLVAGIGCDRGCPMDTLLQLMETTLAQHGLPLAHLKAIASISLKANETGLLTLAEHLQLPTVFLPATTLNRYTDQLTQRSDIVLRETGCYGVAEAAALAHAEQLAGSPAELVIPKHKNARATFAVARAYLEPSP